MKKRWLERQDSYLFAHHQSVVLMDLLMARDVNADFLLRKTGLFYEDVASGNKKLSPEQFAQLCDNASQPPHAADVSFLFGQRMLPGHFGCYSSALQNAPTLRHALQLLVEFSVLFCLCYHLFLDSPKIECVLIFVLLLVKPLPAYYPIRPIDLLASSKK